ncbi:hypothetical protein Tco_0122623 [Tanacetum coccineum]
MCEESRGKNSYALALIELNAKNELKDSLVAVVPYEELISNVNYPPVDEGHQQKNDSTIPSEGFETDLRSLYEQWKETYEDDPYDDADFDSLGLLEYQMTYPKLDICL